MTDRDALRKQRGLQKADVTRRIKRLEVFVAEEDGDNATAALDGLIKAFRAFRDLHDKCTDEEATVHDNYFEETQAPYVTCVSSVKRFLKAHRTAAETSSLVNLPRLELPYFDGEPTDFPIFQQTFNEIVHKAPIDDAAKLARLLQFCKGRAHDAIRSCIHSKNGYARATTILSERFGSPFLITEKLVNDLRSGKSVRTPEEIRHLADELQTSLAILREHGTQSEVESQHFLVAILQRFPKPIQLRWKKYALDSKRKCNKYPSVSHFAQFIAEEADDAMDPVYGAIGGQRHEQQKPKCSFKSNSSSADPRSDCSDCITSSAGPRRQWRCVMCGQSHRLFRCPEFKSKSPEDRMNFVETRELCHVCFDDDHCTDDCKSPYTCTVKGCGGKHSSLIHFDDMSQDETNSLVSNSNGSNCNQACIPTVEVKVNDTCVSAVLDTASDATFCSRSFARTMGLTGKSFSSQLSTMHGSGNLNTEVVSFIIRSSDDVHTLKLSNVIVVDQIPLRSSKLQLHKYKHLRDLNLLNRNLSSSDILIGQDHAEALVPFEVRKGGEGQPYAVKTMFGWCLYGSAHKPAASTWTVTSYFLSTDQHMCPSVQDESLDSQLERWWSIEDGGVSVERAMSVEDQGVLQLWNTEKIFTDGHFQLPIPWRPQVEFPNNKAVALYRLKSLKVNLLKRELFDPYSDQIATLLERGYAECAPAETQEKLWYLPHHLVLNPKKPGKIRVVFDCAARYHGQSLNDKAFSGPDLVNKLLHVLLRFRQHLYAFSCDIEAMYYQVVVPPKDRDALRFLWFEANEIKEYRMTRHLFGGVWCASSSTFALRDAVAHHDVPHAIHNVIHRSFYVDDCLHSSQSVKEMTETALATYEVLQKNGFHLTKFISNADDLKQVLPPSELQDKDKEIVLGVKWSLQDDCFSFDSFHDVADDKCLTRRSMLSFYLLNL